MHNRVRCTKSIFKYSFCMCYVDPHYSNLQSIEYLHLTSTFKSKARALTSHVFIRRCCTNTDSIYGVHFSKLTNALCFPSTGKMFSTLLLLLDDMLQVEARKQLFSEVGANFVTFRKVFFL